MEFLLFILAIVPSAAIILTICRADRVESEPPALILLLVILGAAGSVPAIFGESFIESLFPVYPEGTVQYAMVTGFCVAAFVEEMIRFLILFIVTWRHPAFDYRFDAIVYAIAISMGFACVENVLYVCFSEEPFQTAIVRAIFSVPGHAYDGIIMGVFYGLAKKASIDGNRNKMLGNMLMTLFVPITAHGIWDALCFYDSEWSGSALVLFYLLLYRVSKALVNELSNMDPINGFYMTEDEVRIVKREIEINRANKLLPIGSIIRLRESDKKAMIILINCIVEDEEWEYVICDYPEGVGNQVTGINNEHIEEIYYIGHRCEGSSEAEDKSNEIIEKFDIKTNNLTKEREYPNPSKYYPIGTVFRFKNDNETGLIVSHRKADDPTLEADGDYRYFLFPDGFGGDFFSFDSNDHELISLGYIDRDCYEYMKGLDEVVDNAGKKHENTIGDKNG